MIVAIGVPVLMIIARLIHIAVWWHSSDDDI